MKSTSIKGTQTEKNLLKAFAGESQARSRYKFFSKIAHKEGYEYVAKVFKTITANEHQHAKAFFKLLEGGIVEITASYPAGMLGTTVENLRSASATERDEFQDIYPQYSGIAKEEGFLDIATLFLQVAAIEKTHQQRFMELLNEIESNTMFSCPEEEIWECDKCGHHHRSTIAPEECPVCTHPQAHFRRACTMC